MHTILDGKHGIKYAGVEMESMRAVAKAHKARSLQDFDKCLVDFRERECSRRSFACMALGAGVWRVCWSRTECVRDRIWLMGFA